MIMMKIIKIIKIIKILNILWWKEYKNNESNKDQDNKIDRIWYDRKTEEQNDDKIIWTINRRENIIKSTKNMKRWKLKIIGYVL